MRRTATLANLCGRSWRRRMAWLLFAAYLPMLTFLGHWELNFDIPGTSYYVGLPDPGDGEGKHLHAHLHEQHCHTDAGSCSDLPLVSTASVALLARTFEQASNDGQALPVPSEERLLHGLNAISPELPPPRALLTA